MRSPISAWRKTKTTYRYLGKKGLIVSFTKVINPPAGFGRLPYWVGIIEFPDGERQTSQLVLEGKEPKVGGKVIGIVRKIGQVGKEEIINYGVKFKLL